MHESTFRKTSSLGNTIDFQLHPSRQDFLTAGIPVIRERSSRLLAMQNRLLIRSLMLFLITTCLALALQSSDPTRANNLSYGRNINRDKRLIFKKKPGFVRTLFSVVFEQWNDTKNTFSSVNKLINDNFALENAPVPTTTVSSDPNATTTEAPFRLTRSEFNRILSRNLKGLVRLFNIELQDALKASDNNYAALKKNASLEVSKFL